MTTEADIHFELYRHLQNVIERAEPSDGVLFAQCKAEYGQGIKGFADLVLFDNHNKAWLIIEAKRRSGKQYTRDIDPYAPAVIQQAHSYAAQLGSPFFATYNGRYFVLFRTFEAFKPLAQRVSKSYKASDLSNLTSFSQRLLTDLVRLHQGLALWDSLDQSFVARLRSFHALLEPLFQSQVLESWKEPRFSKKFRAWLEEQGKNVKEMKDSQLRDALATFGTQGAYLFMNKILFYKVLEGHGKYKVPKLAIGKARVVSSLRKQYEKVAKSIDFEAVFDYDPVYDEMVPEEIDAPTREFVKELDSYSLVNIDADVIGKVYEGLLSPEERHDLGQYYTPPAIVELICRLCITDPHSVILDPACGSGGFCIGAYNRLSALKTTAKSTPSHDEILKQIHAIDINKFPAHLTAINLSLRNLDQHTNITNVEVKDFFDFDSLQAHFSFQHVTLSGTKVTKVFPRDYDAVIGNPPYIRRHDMVDVDKPRKHLAQLGIKSFSGWSDIYCYFVTHALQFLKPNGHLGFIVSDRWFYTDYGKDLQEVLLKHCKVKYIIWFEKQQFEVPLISTVVLILERCQDGEERSKNQVVFLRIKEPLEIAAVESLLSTASKTSQEENPRWRIVRISQDELAAVPSWHILFQAPPIYFEMASSGKFVPFSQLAEVSIPEQTGDNDFFYIKLSEAKSWGIENRFLSPLIKSVGQAEYIVFGKTDTELRVLDIHRYVKEIALSLDLKWERASNSGKMRLLKEALKRDEYEGLLAYINHGEELGVDKKGTCERRHVWCDLGDIPTSPLMFPAEYWRRSYVFFNPDHLKLDKHLFYVRPRGDVDEELLAAVTNSVFMPIMRELYGRIATAQAINRNEVWVGQAQSLLLPDVRQFSPEQSNRVREAFHTLLSSERGASPEQLVLLYKHLDHAVASAVGFGNRLNDLYSIRDEFIESRERGKGLAKQVLVETDK